MNSTKKQINTIDEYIHSFPEEIQTVLQMLRKEIKKEIPDAQEFISYGVPTFKLNGKYVVYFAAYLKHISIYPAIFGMEESIPEVKTYKKGKGTLHFPLDKPLPMPLIRKVVQFLLQKNYERTKKY